MKTVGSCSGACNQGRQRCPVPDACLIAADDAVAYLTWMVCGLLLMLAGMFAVWFFWG